jgi:hypothetical protein
MSDIHVHTETPATKPDRVDQLGRVVGVVLVTTVGILAVSLVVWGIVAVWRNILG